MNQAVGRILASFLFLAVFGVYLSGLYPAYRADDSPETAACAYTLGIAHPPGYPLYSMLAKSASLLPLGSIVFRINALAALIGALLSVSVFFFFRREFQKIDSGIASGALIFTAAVFTAFSYAFWDQALGAKSGMYMLNLLLSLVILKSAADAAETYEPKSLYMASFASGLAAANHWPGGLIASAAAAGVFVFRRAGITKQHAAIGFLFLMLGLSPYLYLPVRSGAGALINWGNPSDLAGFLWVVLRKGYSHGASFLSFSGHQLMNFKQFYISNMPYLWPLVFAGLAALYLKARKSFYLYGTYFLLFTASVVFYNPLLYTSSSAGALWLLTVFLLPSGFVSALLAVFGLAWLCAFARARSGAALAVCAALCGALLINANFKRTDSSGDFVYYDYAANLIKTIKPDSAFLTDGDFDFFPLVYEQLARGKRTDLSVYPVSFFMFGWGSDEFRKSYDTAVMVKGNVEANTAAAVKALSRKKSRIYRSAVSPIFDLRLPEYRPACREGVLLSLAKGCIQEPGLFEIYSYRGIHGRSSVKDENIDLFGRYPSAMYAAGFELLKEGRKDAAARVFRRSLGFRGIKNDAAALSGLKMAGEKI